MKASEIIKGDLPEHSIKIVDYDKTKYDYKSYWQNRRYENLSEQHAIKQLMRDMKGNRILDIGGSYGRNIPIYGDKFAEVVILDYSLRTLQENYDEINAQHPNVTVVAGNAMQLPFVDGAFDTTFMIRVLHHLDPAEQAITEIARVLAGRGTHVQEFANKIHFKYLVRNLLSLNFKAFSTEPYQQPTNPKSRVGSDQESIFLNYHPKDISSMFAKYGLKLIEKRGCSYLRTPLLKKVIPQDYMARVDYLLQPLLSGLDASPSIIYRLADTKGKKSLISDLNQIFICPACRTHIDLKGEYTKCEGCAKAYRKVKNVWDLR